MQVRARYALTEGFNEWCKSRSIDSLALQMRVWLKRDIIPVVEETRFFTCPLNLSLHCAAWNLASNRLCFKFVEWMHLGAQLSSLWMSPNEGRNMWVTVRQNQKGAAAAAAAAAADAADADAADADAAADAAADADADADAAAAAAAAAADAAAAAAADADMKLSKEEVMTEQALLLLLDNLDDCPFD